MGEQKAQLSATFHVESSGPPERKNDEDTGIKNTVESETPVEGTSSLVLTSKPDCSLAVRSSQKAAEKTTADDQRKPEFDASQLLA